MPVRLSVEYSWRELGAIRLDAAKLVFPSAPEVPGLYRFDFGDRIYVGETDRLRRRFQGYRTPGPTQTTNIRLNLIIAKVLAEQIIGFRSNGHTSARASPQRRDGYTYREIVAESPLGHQPAHVNWIGLCRQYRTVSHRFIANSAAALDSQLTLTFDDPFSPTRAD
jgi:hypothetical protein